MKCIILCAGKGTRMYPLTKNVPKCLVEYKNTSLLEYKLNAIPETVTEVYLVIGYLGELIIDSYGDHYRHFKINYIWMNNLNGTGGAIELFKSHLKNNEKFLILMGDDIYLADDLEEAIKISEQENKLFIGVFKSENIEGKPLFFDDFDYLAGFDDNSNLENTGLYILDKNYFNFESCTIKDGKEISIPHTLCSNSQNYKVCKYELRGWKKINKIEDLN